MKLSEAVCQFNNWRNFKVGKSTTKGYDLVLKQFCLFTRDCELESVRLTDVMDWFNLMGNLNWDRNSFIPKAIALRKFFEFYQQNGYQVINPWLIPVPSREHSLSRVASEEDYHKLIEAVPTTRKDPRHIRNLAIINLLWDTGARNGELLSLDVNDLNLEKRAAVIRTEKNRGSRPFREIFWTETTNKNLKKWLGKRNELKASFDFKDQDAVFLSLCHIKQGQRLSIKGVGEILRQYCKRADLPYVNAHSFRHHMGHQIIKAGGSNADVANILGHASLQSTMVYTRMSSPEIEQRYRKLVEKI